jgi:hypothetical protein
MPSRKTAVTPTLKGDGRRLKRRSESGVDVYPLGDLPDRWQNDRLCFAEDPDNNPWVSNRTNGAAPAKFQRICAKCPVAVPCLTEGLNECRASAKTNDTAGTRAGTSAFVRTGLYKLWRAGDLDEFRAELIKAKWKPERADEFIAQMPPPPGKKCPRCQTVKPFIKGFYRNKNSSDGRAWRCKECHDDSMQKTRKPRRGESE